MPSYDELRRLGEQLADAMKTNGSTAHIVNVERATFKTRSDQEDQPARQHETESGPKQLLSRSDLPPSAGSPSQRLVSEAIAGEYRYAMFGISLGILSILGGILLGLHGVAGHTSWTASFLGLSSQINDAAPGVVLFVIGLFMIVATKPRVKLKDIKDV